MNHIEELTNEQINMLKHWLFKENIRIEQDKKKLEQDKQKFTQAVNEFNQEKEAHFSMHEMMKKQLIREKKVIDQQLQILKRELTLLSYEKEQLKKDKEQFNSEKHSQSIINNNILFKGINNQEQLKRRYKELIKIFHPDNSGDTEFMQEINKMYEQYRSDR